MLLTQNGKPAAVMMSPAEYDRLVEQEHRRFLAAIKAGAEDIKAGRVVSEGDAARRLGLTRPVASKAVRKKPAR
jgi:PHD/YefM family antitoxin component YafN of YafNO toxin-antitoxin module